MMMPMTAGILIGAFCYARGGMIGLGLAVVASILDHFWGAQVGHWLEDQTRAFLTRS